MNTKRRREHEVSLEASNKKNQQLPVKSKTKKTKKQAKAGNSIGEQSNTTDEPGHGAGDFQQTKQGCIMKVRTTPYPLFNAVHSMSGEQLQTLNEMGFGGLAEMKLDGIPSTLGLHVARNFDPYTMTIKTAKGPIHITEESIRDILGCPMGYIRYDSCSTDDYGVGVKAEWMEQFERELIRPTDVSRQIMMSSVSDSNFKLNFIVVFCNTMGHCKYNGLCDLNVLSRVTPDTRFQDINWCEYILNCLQYCKNTWTGNNEKAFFCGPITTLVVSYLIK